MTHPLIKTSGRYLRHHRLQTALLILGIALGVAVVVAIDIANTYARQSFRLTSASLAGRATYQIVAGAGGIDDTLYRKLRLELGLNRCAPVLEDYVTALSLDNRMMRLLGVDPFAEAPFRNYVVRPETAPPLRDLVALIAEPGTVLMSDELARQFHLTVGDKLQLRRGSRRYDVRLVGLLRADDAITQRALSGLLIADIATAQEIFEQPHRIGRIDLIADPPELAAIKRCLGGRARIVPASERGAALEKLTESFELNLSAVSLLTLVVGMFLVYNTVTFFVVQRRPFIGVLRALGVTRQQIFCMILGETLLLGAAATLVGLALGVLLGHGAVRMVTRTVNDLYYVLTVTDRTVSPLSLLKGAVLGLAASAASALVPAWEAASVAPVGVMRRSMLESKVRRSVRYLAAVGATLAVGGWWVTTSPSRRVDVAYIGLTLSFLGVALCVPLTTICGMFVLGPVCSLFGCTIGRMATRNVVRSLSRTAVAVAALMVSVSIIVGIDVMVGSFRQTVEEWLGTTLQADVYITTPSGTASHFDSIDPGLAASIAKLPGVVDTHTARTVRLESDSGLVFLVAIQGDQVATRRFVWMDGGPQDVRRALDAGAVIVSEPFAWRNQISHRPAQTLNLPTDRGPHRFRIAAIYYDYGTEQGTISLAAATYRRWWRDNRLSSVALYLRPDVNADRFVQIVRKRMGMRGGLALDVMSNRDLRAAALDVFDRTFAITNALHALVSLVAFLGMLGSLMACQLERQREIGVLRASGMTSRQLAAMILFETGLMGTFAGLLALPLGAALAWALVSIINPRSFGWTFAYLPRPHDFAVALSISVAAGLLAGLYPAWRFARTDLAVALRIE